MNAETAHIWTVRLLRLAQALRLSSLGGPHRIAPQRVFGLDFPNPVGLAAGFDKNGEIVRAAFALGFGFVEIGSVTLYPRIGNPRPRVFRLDEDRGVINRYGLPSDGTERVAKRLARLRERPLPGPLGVNIGPDSTILDGGYAHAARKLAPYADYLTINLSCPSEAGSADPVRVLERVKSLMTVDRPVLLKISPDHTFDNTLTLLAEESLIDGLVVGNTTTSRPDGLRSQYAKEPGGLSGAPLSKLASMTLYEIRNRVGPELPIIGVGGIMNEYGAAAKRVAGANLIQIYTGLVYRGPVLIREAARGFSK